MLAGECTPRLRTGLPCDTTQGSRAGIDFAALGARLKEPAAFCWPEHLGRLRREDSTYGGHTAGLVTSLRRFAARTGLACQHRRAIRHAGAIVLLGLGLGDRDRQDHPVFAYQAR